MTTDHQRQVRAFLDIVNKLNRIPGLTVVHSHWPTEDTDAATAEFGFAYCDQFWKTTGHLLFDLLLNCVDDWHRDNIEFEVRASHPQEAIGWVKVKKHWLISYDAVLDLNLYTLDDKLAEIHRDREWMEAMLRLQ